MNKKIRDYFSNSGKGGKVARKVNDAVGGKGMREYFGGTGSKKNAYKSAAKVALTVATLATPFSAAAKSGSVVKAGSKRAAAGYGRLKNFKVKGQKKRVKHYRRGTNPN